MSKDSKDLPRSVTKLAARIFPEDLDRSAFLEALSAGTSDRQALAWLGERPAQAGFDCLPPAPFQPAFVDAPRERQPLDEKGLISGCPVYSLDLSSVFQASPMFWLGPCDRIVDVCSSPGGKAILAWRSLQPSGLVCNEVIGKRLGALVSNVKRYEIPAEVTNAPAEILAQRFMRAAELVIVDAPCSGQSLIARGRISSGAFHSSVISYNVNRQRRILANAAEIVSEGGHLLYSTCTFSPEENEQIIEWLLDKQAAFDAVEVPALRPYRSTLSSVVSYRLFPFYGFGAGGFTALLKRAR